MHGITHGRKNMHVDKVDTIGTLHTIHTADTVDAVRLAYWTTPFSPAPYKLAGGAEKRVVRA